MTTRWGLPHPCEKSWKNLKRTHCKVPKNARVFLKKIVESDKACSCTFHICSQRSSLFAWSQVSPGGRCWTMLCCHFVIKGLQTKHVKQKMSLQLAGIKTDLQKLSPQQLNSSVSTSVKRKRERERDEEEMHTHQTGFDHLGSVLMGSTLLQGTFNKKIKFMHAHQKPRWTCVDTQTQTHQNHPHHQRHQENVQMMYAPYRPLREGTDKIATISPKIILSYRTHALFALLGAAELFGNIDRDLATGRNFTPQPVHFWTGKIAGKLDNQGLVD